MVEENSLSGTLKIDGYGLDVKTETHNIDSKIVKVPLILAYVLYLLL